MSENKMQWQVWDSSCRKDDDGENKNYVRMEQKKKGIHVYMCDKDGDKLKNGSLIAIDFQTQVIILMDKFPEKFGLKTHFDGTPLVCKMVEWETFVDEVNEKMEKESEVSRVEIPPEVGEKLHAIMEKIFANKKKDKDEE